MATVTSQFEQRFQNVVDKMRSTKVLIVLGWTALALASTLAAMACIDYFFETNWAFRAFIFAIAILAAGCAGASLALRALRRWNRNTTAASVENRFEDLGQSVRTSVQFNEQDPINAGVSPRLLEALNKDVEARTEELRLTEAVSSGPLKVSLGLLALVGVLTIGAFVSSWDWRMAISRAFLSNTPYTTVKVEQGDSLVDEKATFVLNADLTGRVDRNVKLLTRELSDESGKWEIQPLGKKDEIKKDVRFVSYEVNIPKIKKPFEYQVVADNYKSPVHTVDVRYPLAIETYHIEVTPPEYTGLGTKVFEKGSFETVQGSYARLSFTLDNPPDRAWIEMKPINTPLGEDPEIETIVLNVDGKNLWTELEDSARRPNLPSVCRSQRRHQDATKPVSNSCSRRPAAKAGFPTSRAVSRSPSARRDPAFAPCFGRLRPSQSRYSFANEQRPGDPTARYRVRRYRNRRRNTDSANQSET